MKEADSSVYVYERIVKRIAPEKDLTGRRFTRLTVISQAPRRRRTNGAFERMWNCLCDCGTKKIIRGTALKCGLTQSCGCLNAENKRTHGMTGSKTYAAWKDIKRRCLNPKSKWWPDYGGRGIMICERWERFENFLEDMGEAPAGMSIDRINNDGSYFKDNCRWATPTQQQRNKRNALLLTINGRTESASTWSEISGVKRITIGSRIKDGWSHFMAVFEKPMPRSERFVWGRKFQKKE